MARTSLAKYVVSLEAETAKYRAELEKANNTLNRFTQNQKTKLDEIASSFKKTGNVIKAAFSALAVGSLFRSVIKNSMDFENSQAQLQAALKSTGEAAGFNAAALNEMASKLSMATGIAGSDISKTQTTLLAFTGIVGDQFTGALQAAIDMSARTGISVVSAAETVGRALDVPSKGLAALSRQGFRFTDQQRKLAEFLESTGRTAEAQQIIIDALQESYGGAAEAARDTLGGAMGALKEAFAQLLGGENSPTALKNSINNLVEVLQSPDVKEAFQALSTMLVDLGASFVTATAESINFFRTMLAGAKTIYESFKFAEIQTTDGIAAANEWIAKRREIAKDSGEAAGGKPKPIILDIDQLNRELDEYDRANKLLKDVKVWKPEDPFARNMREEQQRLDAMRAQEIEFESVVDGLRKQEEVIRDSYDRRLQIIKDNTAESSEYQDQLIARLNEQTAAQLEAIKQDVEEINVFAEQAARSMQQAFADFLFDPFQDGLKGMLNGFLRTIQRMVAEVASQQILTAMLGGLAGSGNSFLAGLGSAFGGGRASGGRVSSGTSYMVGERGPEMFIPGASGAIAPIGGGVQIIDQRGASAPPIDVRENMVNGRLMLQAIVRDEIAGSFADGSMDKLFNSSGMPVRRTGRR